MVKSGQGVDSFNCHESVYKQPWDQLGTNQSLSLKIKTMAMQQVRWSAPGSRFDGVVHLVSSSLIDDLGGGRVAVWWPSRRKGRRWEGELVNADHGKRTVYLHACAYLNKTTPECMLDLALCTRALFGGL